MDVLAGGGEGAADFVDAVDLYYVVVAAGAKKIAAVRGDGEVARMLSSGLIACALQLSASLINIKNGYSVILESMAGV